ncbi:hypothetical protein SAMN05444000_112123 [Shimia gijangensis]|uniref:Uncharacterized protein n=1 Tax=Shimia gijangensis TaxID=1470563 RepID=A0A1M6LW43_9RHOB|nr:hypothetical protein SAMN05444000_112123 [Shimia gijangensis]
MTVELGDASHTVIADGSGNWTTTFEAHEVPTGTATLPITASISDTAGNTQSVSGTVELDTVVDNLGIVSSQTADDIINAAEMDDGFELSGTSEPESTIQVDLEGKIYTMVADAAGNWSVQVEAGDLAQGTYTANAEITATDIAGNIETFNETFQVDTEVDAPNIDSVTYTGEDVRRISTFSATDEATVSTFQNDGAVRTPSYSESTDPVFGTEFTFDTPVFDGTHLVISSTDVAGNESGTLVVLDDNATNAGTIDNPGLINFDISALELDYASDTNIVLTEAQIQSLTGPDDALAIHGGADDTVTVAGAVQTSQVVEMNGQNYNVYTVGDTGTSLMIEQDITVII